ncbi:hypothetical protein V8G54_029141 [Vigna mungo]|uniref:Uncharacterized protein n=1 Tax=Vigna mungo TaxID=3915 RepID=A0AAQ3MU35_VIGMU
MGNVCRIKRNRLGISCYYKKAASKDVVQDNMLDIKKLLDGGETDNSAKEGVVQYCEGDIFTITSGSRGSETAVLSADCFARIRGQEKREEKICEEEGNDENGDGDIGVVVAEKIAKVVAVRVDNVTNFGRENAAGEDHDGEVVTLASPSKVAKVVVFSGDRVLSCGGNVKTACGKAVVSKSNPIASVYRAREHLLQDIKKGKKHSGGGESSSNWEQKEEDAIDNNGARKGEETPVFSWVKREKAANASAVQNTKGATKAHPNSKEKVIQGCKTWHKKSNNLSWKNQATTLLKIVEENRRSILCESWAAVTQMGIDGAAAKSVVATRVDEVRVEILRISKNWAKRIQEQWKSLEEDLPSPKPPDLNCKAVANGIPSYDEDEPLEQALLYQP